MKKLLILMSILILSVPVFASDLLSFSDVSDDNPYLEAIEYLNRQEIVSGNGDGTYAPSRVLNRAELMKVIAEGAAKYYSWPEGIFDLYINSNCFDDVPAGEWYTKYICYGKEMGWVVGYEDGTLFKPSQEVSFVEALKITYMGFGLEYVEGDEVWYKDVVEDASMYNYIPYTINSFEGGLQRDAMADLVTRIIKYESGELETYLGDRADIVVTYDTIKEGEDLSMLIEEEVEVETETENENEIIETTEAVDRSIVIENMTFIDGSIDINVGDSVTWINNDDLIHTVEIDSLEASGNLALLDSFTYTFNIPGTYNYVCGPHPSMTGTITVLEQ